MTANDILLYAGSLAFVLLFVWARASSITPSRAGFGGPTGANGPGIRAALQ